MIEAERPPWLIRRIKAGGTGQVQQLINELNLHTVCSSASCPNQGECFHAGTATFLILGGICTRGCRFCGVPKGEPTEVDAGEADRVAAAVAALGLKHAVITSVTRDDLSDGGSEQFAKCIRAIRKKSPFVTIEVLTPDFQGNSEALREIFDEKPNVFNHNVETVPRLYPVVRPQAIYGRSLDVLNQGAKAGMQWVKSGLMVGLGETEDEVIAVFDDLLTAGVSVLTIGQYLRPSQNHLPVVKYVHPDRFVAMEEEAYRRGFKKVASGPLVRSSYHAEAVLHPSQGF